MARHKHADLMMAYAADTTIKIQYRDRGGAEKWSDLLGQPGFNKEFEYRIKPPEPVVQVIHGHVRMFTSGGPIPCFSKGLLDQDNIKLTFMDGKLTKAEVL